MGLACVKLSAALGALSGTLMLACTTPPASASPPPATGSSMHWYRWHPSARSVPKFVPSESTTGVLGVTAMRELAPLRQRYGFHVVRVLPRLRAAVIDITRTLVAGAPRDARIRYLTRLDATRRLSALPNDPLLSTLDPLTELPYEWQFEAAHVDRALELLPGTQKILVGTICPTSREESTPAGRSPGTEG